MQKFHIARAVSNIATSVQEYSQRLGQTPDLIIPDHYALWRAATLSLSIRTSSNAQSQPLRYPEGHQAWGIESEKVAKRDQVVAIFRAHSGARVQERAEIGTAETCLQPIHP